jgi:endonuclease/exonuclease/phosphatase family metal-dependent hydrolase
MGSRRIFRLIEGSLVALFLIQAVRVVFAMLLSMINVALDTQRVDLLIVNAHLFLTAALILPWFAPRARSTLPGTLSVSAIIVAVGRVFMSFQAPPVRLYSALVVIGFGGVYFASLLRANWRGWVSNLIVAMTFDQLLRAWDTYDFSLRIWFDLYVGDLLRRVPWLAVQILLSVLVVVASRMARRSAKSEPYEPAFLGIWGGLSVGSFLALETLLLAMPNVIARWAGVPYAALVPWLLLATALPLMPGIRELMARTLETFDDRLRGWVWLFMFLVMFVVGNRLGGWGAAGALIVAQFMAVLTLWCVPSPPDPVEVEQVGPSLSVGLFVFVALVYGYSFTFEYARTFAWLEDQGLVVILVAAGLLGVSRLPWREEDPWQIKPSIPRAVATAFVFPVTVLGLILSGLGAQPAPPLPRGTLRLATYNINGGYDEAGMFQMELIARTIEASLADVVALQEVDVGRPVSYGADEVQFLARRLGMYQAYQPTIGQMRGVAILSRWPITGSAGVLIPGAGEQQGALRSLLQEPATGRSIVVVSAQLLPGDDQQRLEQLAVLLSLFDDLSPVVLGADLGFSTEEDVIYQQLLSAGFVDPDKVLGIERGFTFPASNPMYRQDYILVLGATPSDSRQVDSRASDHRLVVVEVGWP